MEKQIKHKSHSVDGYSMCGLSPHEVITVKQWKYVTCKKCLEDKGFPSGVIVVV
jgi:hypothetical protein